MTALWKKTLFSIFVAHSKDGQGEELFLRPRKFSAAKHDHVASRHLRIFCYANSVHDGDGLWQLCGWMNECLGATSPRCRRATYSSTLRAARLSSAGGFCACNSAVESGITLRCVHLFTLGRLLGDRSRQSPVDIARRRHRLQSHVHSFIWTHRHTYVRPGRTGHRPAAAAPFLLPSGVGRGGVHRVQVHPQDE